MNKLYCCTQHLSLKVKIDEEDKPKLLLKSLLLLFNNKKSTLLDGNMMLMTDEVMPAILNS